VTHSNNTVRETRAYQQVMGIGIEKGRVEGLQKTRAIQRRFGDLPDWAVTQLQKANTEQLEAWAEQIFDAPDVETLLGSS